MNDLNIGEQHQTSEIRRVHGMGRRIILWTLIGVTVGAASLLWLSGRIPGERTDRVYSGPGAVIAVVTDGVPVSAGGVFAVDIVLEADEYDVTAGDITLLYDADTFQPVGVESASGFVVLAEDLSVSGEVAFVVGSGTSPVPGGGTVAKITFRALRGGQSMLTISPASQAAASGYDTDIIREFRGASVTVQ